MSKSKLRLLGQDILPGTSSILKMELAKLHTRNTVSIPVIVERAKLEGPVLLLLAGVHGDETNGVAILRDIIRKKINKPDRGTVVCIPVFNIFGYLNHSRKFPDGRDLNRVFPGSANGSLASQFAHRFTKEIAPNVDYVIDYHTGGAGRDNFPNIRCYFPQAHSFELAKVFNAPFIVNSTMISKSIREMFNKLGKTTLLFEGGKSLSLDQRVIDNGVEGALNVMRFLKMHAGDISTAESSKVITKSKWIRAPHSGMFQPMIANGSFVKKKAVIGRISDPYGQFEKLVKAPFDCYIYGVNTAPSIHKGDAIFHISVTHFSMDQYILHRADEVSKIEIEEKEGDEASLE